MSSAFFYVDGTPTKGKWVDMDGIDNFDEVLEELAESGFIPRDEDGDPAYGGDLLVADCEGLAKAFYHSRSDTIDLEEFIEARDHCESNGVDEEAVIAYMGNIGSWDEDTFSETYQGKHDSEVDFAESFADDTGLLDDMPENLRMYFDFGAYARDLFISDMSFIDGHVFSNR